MQKGTRAHLIKSSYEIKSILQFLNFLGEELLLSYNDLNQTSIIILIVSYNILALVLSILLQVSILVGKIFGNSY